MDPLISIIIPTYNRASFIGKTLDSILAQTYKNWECIVVDDGSTDDTKEVLKAYCDDDSRFRFYMRPKNKPKGANACRNYGFELSKGDFINWFDSDDIMHPKKIIEQVEALENSEFKFSVCQSFVFKHSVSNILGLRSENIFSKDCFFDYLIQKNVWLTGAPLWSKSFLKTLNSLFDETLQVAQEWEFHCRVLSSTCKYHVIAQPLVYIREHSESITYNSNYKKRTWGYFEARWKLYKNNTIVLDQRSSNYLSTYFINNFKNLVRERKLIESVKFCIKFILPDNRISLSGKFLAVIATFVFLFFNKGDAFLSKIK